ncbi:hypothetical protein NEHOM01_2126 [Nematocida homosporus]|uniref:uncharacterized protein n=1 Tax=Nematocida homosporus TaxID=1912981 RepID=UPI00221F7FEB|nr:uncharacterized protein NEHOM01_2126 [Nematocida homosporus]KAI5187372.1 hypothetical protein NEHOM01_2126 [Nematocida homosporus]
MISQLSLKSFWVSRSEMRYREGSKWIATVVLVYLGWFGLVKGEDNYVQIDKIDYYGIVVNNEKLYSIRTAISLLTLGKAIKKGGVRWMFLIWVQIKRGCVDKDEEREMINHIAGYFGCDNPDFHLNGLVVEWCDFVASFRLRISHCNELFKKARVSGHGSFLLLLNPPLAPTPHNDKEDLNNLQLITKEVLKEEKTRFLETYWLIEETKLYQGVQVDLKYLFETIDIYTQTVTLVVLDMNIEKIKLTQTEQFLKKPLVAYCLQRLVLYTPHAKIGDVDWIGPIFITTLEVHAQDWQESLQQIFKTPVLVQGLERLQLSIWEERLNDLCDHVLLVNVDISCQLIQKIEVNITGEGSAAAKIEDSNAISSILTHLMLIIGLSRAGDGKCQLQINQKEQPLVWQEALKESHKNYSTAWVASRLYFLRQCNYIMHTQLFHGNRIDLLGPCPDMPSEPRVLFDAYFRPLAFRYQELQEISSWICPQFLSVYILEIRHHQLSTIHRLDSLFFKLSEPDADSSIPHGPELVEILCMGVYISQVSLALLSYAGQVDACLLHEPSWDTNMHQYYTKLIDIAAKARVQTRQAPLTGELCKKPSEEVAKGYNESSD